MVLLDTGTPDTSREIFSEDADGETRIRNPSIILSHSISLIRCQSQLSNDKYIMMKELLDRNEVSHFPSLSNYFSSTKLPLILFYPGFLSLVVPEGPLSPPL